MKSTNKKLKMKLLHLWIGKVISISENIGLNKQ